MPRQIMLQETTILRKDGRGFLGVTGDAKTIVPSCLNPDQACRLLGLPADRDGRKVLTHYRTMMGLPAVRYGWTYRYRSIDVVVFVERHGHTLPTVEEVRAILAAEKKERADEARARKQAEQEYYEPGRKEQRRIDAICAQIDREEAASRTPLPTFTVLHPAAFFDGEEDEEDGEPGAL
jgi:hypothetical protein